MVRCPVHDELHEQDEPCPRLGQGNSSLVSGDCEMHRVPKKHEEKRLKDAGVAKEKEKEQTTIQ